MGGLRSFVPSVRSPAASMHQRPFAFGLRHPARQSGLRQLVAQLGALKVSGLPARRVAVCVSRWGSPSCCRMLVAAIRPDCRGWDKNRRPGGAGHDAPPRVAAGELHQYLCRIRLTVSCVRLSDGVLGAANWGGSQCGTRSKWSDLSGLR